MEPVKLQWSRGQGTVESVEGAFIDIGDRNILMVTRSIETIGMGRFQWKLAFSSGFGFLVDQARSSPRPSLLDTDLDA